METKLINPGNLSSIRSNLCNKRWNSTINSCCKQRIYFCSIQRNTCLPSNILKTHLHHNSALLFTDSESKHFSNMAGNAKMKWHPGSRARFQLSNGKKKTSSLSHNTILNFVIALRTLKQSLYSSGHNCKARWLNAEFVRIKSHTIMKELNKNPKRTRKNNLEVLICVHLVQSTKI